MCSMDSRKEMMADSIEYDGEWYCQTCGYIMSDLQFERTKADRCPRCNTSFQFFHWRPRNGG